MTSDETRSAVAAGGGSGLTSFLRMAAGFWKGEGAGRAWGLTLLVLAMVIAQVGVQLLMNAWNKWFFDALEKKDGALVAHYMLIFAPVIVVSAIVVTTAVVARMTLQMRWREWLTRKILGWWISDQRYYRLAFVAPEQTSPEYRIAEDARLAIEPLVDFATGLLTALFTAVSFAAILWQVAGSARLSMGGWSVVVPAYMAVAALCYAVIASFASWLAGRPLARTIGEKNEIEAGFRGEMTRLRENAESIALIRGDAGERATLGETYTRVVEVWRAVIRRQGVIGVVLNTHGAIYPIVPLLLIAPKYLAGEITLGAVMQVTAAFMAVQGALIWFVDNVVRLAEWFASVRRVNELVDVLREVDAATLMSEKTAIEMGESEDGTLHLEDLSIAHRNGRVVIAETSTSIAPGERVLVVGESGTGKSTLIRAIAGLWPWGSGAIRLPKGATIAFLPQKPYIPLGGLREVMSYPLQAPDVGDDAIIKALNACGLGYLVKHIDDEQRWDQTLSGGERQRVAFGRLAIQKPDVVIMDESTSALDEESQARVLTLLAERLPDAMIISVAHRPGLEEFHTRKITLARSASGASLSSQDMDGPLHRLLRRLKNEVFAGKGA